MDKRYLKNVGIYVLSAILSILVIAYLLYHLFSGFSQDVETMAADIVTVSETFTADAYIFREEKLIESSNDGSVGFLYDDGTRVRKNSVIANVYTAQDTAEFEKTVSDLERQISILENSAIAKDVTITDSRAIDAQIDSLYYTLGAKLNSGDYNYVFRRKDELLTLLNKRQLLLKSVNNFDTRLAELEGEKNSLTASLGGIKAPIHAGASGYLYSDVDGYESIFTVEAASTLTISDFHRLTEALPVTVKENVVGKIATDFVWYIGCELPSVQQQYYKVGAKYDVKFPYSGDQVVPMELSRIVTAADEDSIVLIFSTGNVPDGFSFLRKQTVEIVQQSYTGYRVPVSAVRIQDDRQGVFVKSGNLAIFKEITPLVEIDGYFIVAEQDKLNDPDYTSKLGMYDLVIVKGKNLYDNKIIQ